jgi:hypothetical protein
MVHLSYEQLVLYSFRDVQYKDVKNLCLCFRYTLKNQYQMN